MPHQCVRCGKMYDDGASEVLDGCGCGSKLFYYIRSEKLEEIKEMTHTLSDKDKKQIEDDVFDIIGDKPENLNETVVLDLESIRALKPGQFELDLVSLFNKKNPVVFKTGDGKYMIDVASTFRRASQVKEDDTKEDDESEDLDDVEAEDENSES
ncbi:MAG: Zn-ribbon domain-containing protein [Candidatus Woesearchaeota archaeon]